MKKLINALLMMLLSLPLLLIMSAAILNAELERFARERTGEDGYTVFNKKHYQLTHLLEYGHQSRNGGRVRAFSHIAPVNEQIGDMIAGMIERKLGG